LETAGRNGGEQAYLMINGEGFCGNQEEELGTERQEGVGARGKRKHQNTKEKEGGFKKKRFGLGAAEGAQGKTIRVFKELWASKWT